jgi:hypothetical protein
MRFNKPKKEVDFGKIETYSSASTALDFPNSLHLRYHSTLGRQLEGSITPACQGSLGRGSRFLCPCQSPSNEEGKERFRLTGTASHGLVPLGSTDEDFQNRRQLTLIIRH